MALVVYRFCLMFGSDYILHATSEVPVGTAAKVTRAEGHLCQ